ncbi:helicase [Sulfolobales archaeon HS-7]|nr:helicase [Sulfolobales archaeon HS-7]
MIEFAEPVRSSSIYKELNPIISRWFKERYTDFTMPQKMSILPIKGRQNILISSPTGTGKTLSAFLGIIDELITLAQEGRLEDKIYAVYISPLRALNNDMNRNLLQPLNEIYQIAEANSIKLQEIRIGVRTSDTPSYQKQKMLRNPPHILITTPESFVISLASLKFKEKLTNVNWFVIDEIHELASSKRGSYLMGGIEIFSHYLSKSPFARIGLSATVSPLEKVAEFLVGIDRDCLIADARFAKPIDIKVMSPVKDLIHADDQEVSEGIYSTLIEEVKKHRTTLVFTNTRSAAERVSYKLRNIVSEEKLFDSDLVGAHHSSLGRDVRLDVEEKLKNGQLKVVVSSTSLELGIDIGYIDIVILLSSPKSVSRLLQRIGRSGHHIRTTSKGKIIVVDRDDLVECSVLAKLALERKIDSIHIPRNPLDVLTQLIIVATLASTPNKDELFQVLKKSYTFSELPRKDFDSVISYLLGDYSLEDRNVYSKLREDAGILKNKRGLRMMFFMNSGTIPDETKILARDEKGKVIGTLEEEFVENLVPGDIFVLGGKTYQFLTSKGSSIIIRDAMGKRPTVPSWISEMLPLAYDSALEIGKFRGEIGDMIKKGVNPKEIINYIVDNYQLTMNSARAIFEYVGEQFLFTNGIVPSEKTIVVEIYDDSEGNRNLIFHMLFGRRTVEAISKIFAYAISNEYGVDVRIGVNDNGFVLTLPGRINVNINDIITWSVTSDAEEVLANVILRTEMLRRRFRHVAERSFMLLKRYKGRETSIERRQLNSYTLINVVKDIPNFPVLKETIREILEDYMDIAHAKEIMKKIANKEISIVTTGPEEVPSPFAHSIIIKEYSDVVLASDKRNLIAQLHEKVLEHLKKKGINVNLLYTQI